MNTTGTRFMKCEWWEARRPWAAGLAALTGLALDDLGDVFVTSLSQGTTLEVPSVGLQSNFAPWLGGGGALATDAAGDVYIADNVASSVTEVPAGCASSACDIALPGGYGFVDGLALDSAGDLYIADQNNGPLYEVQRSQPPALSFPSTRVGVTSSALTVAIQNIGNQPADVLQLRRQHQLCRRFRLDYLLRVVSARRRRDLQCRR